MTQEEKQLLFKDLSARLQYGVKVEVIWKEKLTDVDGYEGKLTSTTIMLIENDEVICRPYLRPLSSMTEEEDKEYAKVIVKSQDCSFENSESATTIVNDWYLSKGFDVRGLISKGLALEAPEGMYK